MCSVKMQYYCPDILTVSVLCVHMWIYMWIYYIFVIVILKKSLLVCVDPLYFTTYQLISWHFNFITQPSSIQTIVPNFSHWSKMVKLCPGWGGGDNLTADWFSCVWWLGWYNIGNYTSQKKKRNTHIFAVFFSMVSWLNHSVNRWYNHVFNFIIIHQVGHTSLISNNGHFPDFKEIANNVICNDLV